MREHAIDSAAALDDLHHLAKEKSARLGVVAMHGSGGGPGVLLIEVVANGGTLRTTPVQAGPAFLAEARSLFQSMSGGMV